jgi:Tfp pilus assembly protein PilX
MISAAASITSDQRVFWEIALGIGLVVVLVVIALLTLLTTIVRDIDLSVAALWTMAKRMAANTATTYQLGTLANSLDDVNDELTLHNQLLSRQ